MMMIDSETRNGIYKQKLIIVGAGGHATSVASIAVSAGFDLVGFVDSDKAGNIFLGMPVFKSIGDMENLHQYNYAIAVGDNSARQRLYGKLTDQYEQIRFPPLVHNSAIISIHASIGKGTVVMPNAVVGPNTSVGEFCILNTMSSIDHDCVMQDYTSVAPGVITGGNVKIGLRTAISIGAIIKHGIEIGEDSVVGANSYVNKNVDGNVVVYGIPAKVKRNRKIGDPYLS